MFLARPEDVLELLAIPGDFADLVLTRNGTPVPDNSRCRQEATPYSTKSACTLAAFLARAK